MKPKLNEFKKLNKIILNLNQLPVVVEVSGKPGEREFYELKAAGRKFGASLCKVENPLRQLLFQEK